MSKKKLPLRLEYIDPADLEENPANWRRHPAAQADALTTVLGKVGWAGALLMNESTGRLIDGHARKELDETLLVEGKVPVLVGSWSEDDEAFILGTLDPIGAMAMADEAQLGELLERFGDDEDLRSVLDSVRVMDWTAETVRLDDLKPHPRNYREHPDDQVEHLAQSLKEFGFYRRLVISSDDYLLIGHGIWQATKSLGMEVGPAFRLGFPHDDPRALKLLTADNEIEHLAEVDDRARTELLKEIKENDALLGTGFDDEMLALLAMVTRPKSEIENFDAAAEWVGLPDFQELGSPSKLVINFPDAEAKIKFAKDVLKIDVTKKTRGIWWPPREREDHASLEYGLKDEAEEDEESEDD